MFLDEVFGSNNRILYFGKKNYGNRFFLYWSIIIYINNGLFYLNNLR